MSAPLALTPVWPEAGNSEVSNSPLDDANCEVTVFGYVSLQLQSRTVSSVSRIAAQFLKLCTHEFFTYADPHLFALR